MQSFNYHTHTYRCGHADMDYTDEDYIKDYIKTGLKKVAFTDHAPQKNEIDKRPNVRMKYADRLEYLESINKLKQKYKDKIEIQSGYEVEYLPGEEENLLELKNETDILILGQHYIYDDEYNLKIIRFREKELFTEKEFLRYANYIEKAMEYKIVDIIAHPDLFILSSDGFREIQEKISNMICESAQKYNIPLEINLNRIFYEMFFRDNPTNNLDEVLYPCKEFWEIASQYDIKVLYGLDVHHKNQISLFNKLVEIANKKIGEKTIEKLNFISL